MHGCLLLQEFPSEYDTAIRQAQLATKAALADGLKLLEVEFPVSGLAASQGKMYSLKSALTKLGLLDAQSGAQKSNSTSAYVRPGSIRRRDHQLLWHSTGSSRNRRCDKAIDTFS